MSLFYDCLEGRIDDRAVKAKALEYCAEMGMRNDQIPDLVVCLMAGFALGFAIELLESKETMQ